MEEISQKKKIQARVLAHAELTLEGAETVSKQNKQVDHTAFLKKATDAVEK